MSSPGWADNWYGIVVPAAIPQAVADKLDADCIAVLKDPEVKDRLATQGILVVGNSTPEFVEYVQAE